MLTILLLMQCILHCKLTVSLCGYFRQNHKDQPYVGGCRSPKSSIHDYHCCRDAQNLTPVPKNHVYVTDLLFSVSSPDCYRLCLPVSVQEVGSCWHSSRQQRVDVRVWPRSLRPPCLVRPLFLLPACLPWRWAAISLWLCLGGQFHTVTTREAAVQSNAVLLGSLCPHRWPFLQSPSDNFLPGAASARLATLLWYQWVASHEPDSAFTCTSGNQKPCMRLLGPTGLLVTGKAKHI